jgi:hypothetical protein
VEVLQSAGLTAENCEEALQLEAKRLDRSWITPAMTPSQRRRFVNWSLSNQFQLSSLVPSHLGFPQPSAARYWTSTTTSLRTRTRPTTGRLAV